MKLQSVSLFVLRVMLGWFFFWAGITKVVDPTWSAQGYLASAKALPGFYHWLTGPGILPLTNFVNEWGLTLLGISLILGIAVRLSGILGMVLMLLYRIPLGIVHPDAHSLVVEQHLIFIASLWVLVVFRAGRFGGLASWCARLPICARYPKLRALLD